MNVRLLLTSWAVWCCLQAPATDTGPVGAPTAMPTCVEATFTGISRPAVTVRAVRFVNPATFEPVATINDLTGFCRVEASISAAPGSVISFEVWVPPAWNGKLVVTGNGGYGNVPSYRDMAWALRQGYAAAGGDTGHQTATPDDLLWGVDHPARIEDWGSRSIHGQAGTILEQSVDVR